MLTTLYDVQDIADKIKMTLLMSGFKNVPVKWENFMFKFLKFFVLNPSKMFFIVIRSNDKNYSSLGKKYSKLLHINCLSNSNFPPKSQKVWQSHLNYALLLNMVKNTAKEIYIQGN